MDRIVTENLFLLEFLVDNVDLNPKICEGPCATPGDICVAFQFLDNAPLDVCPQDFGPNPDPDSMKSGKSCLFSLSPEQANAAMTEFYIVVSVMKKMQPGWLPEKIEIGGALIAIADLFNELISSVEMSDGSTPTAKTLKDVFDIMDNQSQVIGKISVYIRMSCFGKLIVTQFQMNLDDKSVLFKDKEGKNLYRYKKAGKKKEESGRRSSSQQPQTRFNADCPRVPCGLEPDPVITDSSCPYGPCLGSAGGNNYQQPSPNAYNQNPCNECGFNPSSACAPSSMGGETHPTAAPDGNYQEIGASMGGNSLTIRVHKDKGKAEQVDPNAVDDCTCCGQTTGKSQQQQQANQQFSIRPGATPNSPFSFRMGGDSAGANNNVVVNPPVYSAPDGTQFTEFSDPNKETFILRIGKKSEGIDKKNNLELELQTPKGPPLKPIPKKETVETQYDPIDCGPETGKAGKAKGGKDKGGKKKKK